mmetsp:Transcript_2270/g.7580  ORF Transcript_2270/g.7580 Transcript_2270/m.7580 type:complete len:206 (-) Transcript_2270:261-878(-)
MATARSSSLYWHAVCRSVPLRSLFMYKSCSDAGAALNRSKRSSLSVTSSRSCRTRAARRRRAPDAPILRIGDAMVIVPRSGSCRMGFGATRSVVRLEPAGPVGCRTRVVTGDDAGERCAAPPAPPTPPAPPDSLGTRVSAALFSLASASRSAASSAAFLLGERATAAGLRAAAAAGGAFVCRRCGTLAAALGEGSPSSLSKPSSE